jgi:hypothetical protein
MYAAGCRHMAAVIPDMGKLDTNALLAPGARWLNGVRQALFVQEARVSDLAAPGTGAKLRMYYEQQLPLINWMYNERAIAKATFAPHRDVFLAGLSYSLASHSRVSNSLTKNMYFINELRAKRIIFR